MNAENTAEKLESKPQPTDMLKMISAEVYFLLCWTNLPPKLIVTAIKC